MNLRNAWSLAAAMGALSTVPAYAFGPDLHADITDAALKASKLAPPPLNTNWEFAPKIRQKVGKINKHVDLSDLAGTRPGTAKNHFDDSLLYEGAQRLIEIRRDILTELKNAESIMSRAESSSDVPGDFADAIDDAHTYLGRAHHSIQDFYAHTNWVESGAGGVAPMVWMFGNNVNPFPPGITSHCDICGTTPQGGLGIFSGEFRVPYDRMLEVVLSQPGTCIHGPGYPMLRGHQVILPPEGCPEILTGMNKDNPGSTPEERANHDRAVLKATLATAAYTQGILIEAQSLGYYAAICGLLGYTNGAPCLAKETESEEFTFPFTTFSGPGNYKTDEVFTWDIPKFDASKGALRSIATKWEWEVTGLATCPADPSAVIPDANTCLALRRIGALAVSSPDMNVAALYCNTWPNLKTHTCGLNSVMPDTFGFSYISWPSGNYQVELDADDYPPTELRYISKDLSAYEAASPGETFKLNGSFVSRLLFNLGVNYGGGREPGTYSGTGAYLGFDGQMKIRITVDYEYVPRQR